MARLKSTCQDTPHLTKQQAAENQARAARVEAAERERQRNWLVTNLESNLGPRYSSQRCSLDRFQIYHPAQKAVVEQLRTLDLAAMVNNGGGLVFYGPCGGGKDHLCAAMLYTAARQHGITGKWINGQEWFGQIRDGIEQGRLEESIMDDLFKPAILAVSDPIPARRDPSPFNVEMLYRLVDRRYRHLKSTWVTLNAATPEDADERLSAPVFDRLRDGATFIKCFWPSYRERQTNKGASR